MKLMSRLEKLLFDLKGYKEYPSISIIISSHQSLPEKTHNKTIIKDCLENIKKKFKGTSEEREIIKVIQSIENLLQEHDFSKADHGLGIFANQHYKICTQLPFSIHNHCSVGHGFYIAPLLYELKKLQECWILLLHEKMSHLYTFDGKSEYEEIITPLTDDRGNPLQGFPLDFQNPSSKVISSYAVGDRDAHYLDEHMKHYFHIIDKELGNMLNKHAYPVIVCGTEKQIALFKNMTKHTGNIISYIGSDFRTIEAYTDKILLAIQKHQSDTEQSLIKNFIEAAGKRLQAYGIQSVWRSAFEGRIHHLLIEEDAQFFGQFDLSNNPHIFLYGKDTDGPHNHNITELLINQILHTDGKISFVKNGSLSDYDKIGAILRYS